MTEEGDHVTEKEDPTVFVSSSWVTKVGWYHWSWIRSVCEYHLRQRTDLMAQDILRHRTCAWDGVCPRTLSSRAVWIRVLCSGKEWASHHQRDTNHNWMVTYQRSQLCNQVPFMTPSTSKSLSCHKTTNDLLNEPSFCRWRAGEGKLFTEACDVSDSSTHGTWFKGWRPEWVTDHLRICSRL